MKVKELMLGNLINQQGKETRIYQVEHRYKTTYRINDIIIDERILQDYFTPIPISKKYLKKFGFVVNEFFDSATKKRIVTVDRSDKVAEFTLHKSGDEYWLDLIYGHCSSYASIKYVHQLQNFYFSVTGSEITK